MLSLTIQLQSAFIDFIMLLVQGVIRSFYTKDEKYTVCALRCVARIRSFYMATGVV